MPTNPYPHPRSSNEPRVFISQCSISSLLARSTREKEKTPAAVTKNNLIPLLRLISTVFFLKGEEGFFE
jgi:hypothetical protein